MLTEKSEERIAHFLVGSSDEKKLQEIYGLSKEYNISPQIVYHGKVLFRNARETNRFPVFSRDASVYNVIVNEQNTIEDLKAHSLKIQRDLLLSPYPLVGCIGREIKSVLLPDLLRFAGSIQRSLIIFENCPYINRWVKAYCKFMPFGSMVKQHVNMEQVFVDLRKL